MLTAYRRHVQKCPHKYEGRQYRRYLCPIWVDGFLGEVELRKSLQTKDWEKAQRIIRDWEAKGMPAPEEQQAMSLEKAWLVFMADAESRELEASTLRKYRQFQKQLLAVGAKEGLLFIKQWDVEVVRRFRSSWNDSGLTVVKKLERLRAFFRFAQDCEWIDKNPAAKLKSPTVKQTPTMPFNQEDMVRIFAACDSCPGNKNRMRALILLLRYSGLRIGDAVRLAQDRIVDCRLFLYTQKTDTPVWCPVPEFVVQALESFPR
jgi:site-specific recombinase XerD